MSVLMRMREYLKTANRQNCFELKGEYQASPLSIAEINSDTVSGFAARAVLYAI